MINGFVEEPSKELSIIKTWILTLIEKINEEVKEIKIKALIDPIVSYVDEDSTKDITAMCIIDTGYIVIRIWEKEKGIFILHFDMHISSPLPALLVVNSIADNLGMYDGVRMLVDREYDFKVLEHKSYP
jgi:hypothetical protein